MFQRRRPLVTVSVQPPNHPLQPHATGTCRRQLTENSMARMVVIYKAPKDPVAFDKHYVEVHVPLAKKLPGLRKYDVSRGSIVAPAGGQGCHLIATLHFDDLPA